MPLPVARLTHAPLYQVKTPTTAGRTNGQARIPAHSSSRPCRLDSRQPSRLKQRWMNVDGEPFSGRNPHTRTAPLPALTMSSARAMRRDRVSPVRCPQPSTHRRRAPRPTDVIQRLGLILIGVLLACLGLEVVLRL